MALQDLDAAISVKADDPRTFIARAFIRREQGNLADATDDLYRANAVGTEEDRLEVSGHIAYYPDFELEEPLSKEIACNLLKGRLHRRSTSPISTKTSIDNV
jgi:hypothetical protein